MAEYTKGDWKAGYNPDVTGPTTPTTTPFCGGKDWPYRTINVGEETIAIVPAQAKSKIIGHRSEAIIETAVANAHLIAAAPLGDKLASAVLDANFDDYDDFLELKELAKQFKNKAEGKTP